MASHYAYVAGGGSQQVTNVPTELVAIVVDDPSGTAGEAIIAYDTNNGTTTGTTVVRLDAGDRGRVDLGLILAEGLYVSCGSSSGSCTVVYR